MRSKFDILLAILGVISLFCLSPIGAMLALIAAIAIIGLPLTVIMGAIPTLFLFLLIARLVQSIIPVRGIAGMAIGGTVSLAVLAIVPWLANQRLAATADALVAGDMAKATPQRYTTLAVVDVGTRSKNDCGDFCQRALLNGAVDRMIVARAAALGDAPDAALAGTAYRIEQRQTCPPLDLKDGVDPLRLAGEKRSHGDPSPADMLRLLAARGSCVVAEPATVGQADAVIGLGSIRKGVAPVAAGMSPFADTLSASRLSLHVRENSMLVERHRATSVIYHPLLPILAPSYVGGYGLELRAGLLRRAVLRGDRDRYEAGPSLGAFLQDVLKMDLVLRDMDADAETAQAIAGILDGSQPPDRTSGKIINRLFERMRARPKAATPEDAELALRVLAEPRIPIPRDVGSAVRAFRDDTELASRLAAALFARLDDTPPDQREDDPSYLGYTLSYLAGAIEALPDEAVRPYRADLEALARDRSRRVIGHAALRKLSVFGASAVPTLVYLIDDANAGKGKAVAGDKAWQHPYLAGLQGLCLAGPDAAAAVPMLIQRLDSGQMVKFGSYWDLTVTTLASLGATADEIWPHVQTENQNASRERFDRVVARAARKRDCAF